MTAPRIFWFGMHKVLKTTELRQLRRMGYEVFNPAYISPIYDQSADRRVDVDQPTSLPPEVFDALIAYDFFYRPISPDIARLLNTYFDVVIVTINGSWLSELLKVYHGRVIYRIYGQHYSLAQHLSDMGLVETLVTRGEFEIVPFAPESVSFEAEWFQDLITECVPYQIPDDVFEADIRWGHRPLRREIAVSFPNVENPYYAAAYQRFAKRFNESYFKIYGPQRSTPDDSRFVGNLPRRALLAYFAESAGYYYDFNDSVCYLPPIETMQLGGPVVCGPGSLLAQFFERGAPNVSFGVADAKAKLERLLAGDRGLAAELIAAQEPVRRRYDRTEVQEAFSASFGRILGAPGGPEAPAHAARGRLIASGPSEATARQVETRVLIALHIDGVYVYQGGRALAFEGIPRVMDLFARAICAAGPEAGVVVTVSRRSLGPTMDYFRRTLPAGRVEFLVIDEGDTPLSKLQARLRLVEQVNADPSITTVVIPHYYLFPEFLRCEKRMVMTIFDYYPHLMPHQAFDRSFAHDAENKRVGVALSRKADRLMTASDFTARYLPEAGFGRPPPAGEVVVFPLPTLGVGRDAAISDEEARTLLRVLGPSPFLFYPTANRPNKEMAFLARVFAAIRMRRPDLRLVLTCSLDSVPGVSEAFDNLEVRDHVVLLHHASEGLLRWLYANARALCMTSALEGNFPPQVSEALYYRAPVVSTRLPQIEEELGAAADGLLLCRPRSLQDFADALDLCLRDREGVLARQEPVRTRLLELKTEAAFAARVLEAFPEFAAIGGAAP